MLIALRAELAEIRRSDDRLLSTVHWTLATVLGAALILAGFGWLSSSRLHARDMQVMRDDLTKAVTEQRSALETSLERSMIDRVDRSVTAFRSQLEQTTAAQVSTVHLEIARVETDMFIARRDYSMALNKACDMFNQAQRGNTNYAAHALDFMVTILQQAKAAGAVISEQDKRNVINVLYHPAAVNDARKEVIRELIAGEA